ncbi:MAG: cell wall hydrolase [Caulobacteraceae bacterium]
MQRHIRAGLQFYMRVLREIARSAAAAFQGTGLLPVEAVTTALKDRWWLGVNGLFVAAVLAFGIANIKTSMADDSPWVMAAPSPAAAAKGYSNAYIAAMMVGDAASAMRIATRFEPGAPAPLHPYKWASYDLSMAPPALFTTRWGVDAQRVNAIIPITTRYNPVARPLLVTGGGDREQAITCLTAAVYYEAANEPRMGQEAVAQVVINRTRHPMYPKSVCGVVFQGSERYTGCQFSFTCDGSMARVPVRDKWAQARDVATRALSGYVMQAVGSATHYHANYVMPYWSPTRVKVAQFGLHIFYRPVGPSQLFGGYRGGEARFSKVSMIGKVQPRRFAPVIPGANGAFQSLPMGYMPIQIARAAYTPDGRVRAVLGGQMLTGMAPEAPMHSMIAMRKAAMQAALNQRGAQSAISADNARAAKAAAAVVKAEAPPAAPVSTSAAAASAPAAG